MPLPELLSLAMVRGEAEATAPPVLTHRKLPVLRSIFPTNRSEVDCAILPCTVLAKRPGAPKKAGLASVLRVKKIPEIYRLPVLSRHNDWPRSPAGAPPNA